MSFVQDLECSYGPPERGRDLWRSRAGPVLPIHMLWDDSISRLASSGKCVRGYSMHRFKGRTGVNTPLTGVNIPSAMFPLFLGSLSTPHFYFIHTLKDSFDEKVL